MNVKRILASLATASALLSPALPVQAQAGCVFTLGFATLRNLAGSAVVGDCLENEHFNVANGNAEQATTKGLLVWRKSDNFTAFSDGYRSWVNGPYGVQVRLNTERFDWERDPVVQPTPTPVPMLGQPCSPEGAVSGVLPPVLYCSGGRWIRPTF